jgi:peptide/nickel transport system permease protein
MIGFAARRLTSMLLVMLAVSVLVFLIFNAIPNGDPAQLIAGDQATETQIEVIRREWGFDQPLPVQYVNTMEKLFGGELVSYINQLDVREEIWKGVPRTLSLALGAALLWILGGVGLAVFTALKAGGTTDRLLSGLALAAVSIPGFWLAAMMSHYLGFELGLFPNGGYVPLTEDPIQWLWHMVLPWTALAILFVGVYARVLHVSLLEAMNEDYVRTARAKGVSERRVILRHALRNALVPVVALWGLDVGAVIGGGAILIESIFNLQGVGQYAASALDQLDLPAIMAVTIYGAFFIVILNTIADLIQAALDPRLRLVSGALRGTGSR